MNMMLLVRILFIDSSLHKHVVLFIELSFAWGQARSKLGGGGLIPPICITILYHNLLLFIDIFHIGTQYLCYFIYFACFIIIGGSSTGARILLEKAPSERNISEDQLWKEISRKFLFFQMTEGARRGRRGDPRWAQTMGRRGPWPGRATMWSGGPTAPFASFSSRTPSSRKPKPQRGPHEGLQPPLRGGEHQREKSSPAGRNPPGKFPPGGGNRRHRHRHRAGHHLHHHHHHLHHLHRHLHRCISSPL